MDKDYPAIQRLNSCVSAEDMANICDMKGDDDLQAYRISEDRVLAWLRQKVISKQSTVRWIHVV